MSASRVAAEPAAEAIDANASKRTFPWPNEQLKRAFPWESEESKRPFPRAGQELRRALPGESEESKRTSVRASEQLTAEQRQAIIRRARVHASGGRYAHARGLYDVLLAYEPLDREARLAVARVDAWDQRFDRAAERYRTLLREQPRDVEALAGWIDVLVWTARLQEAQAETRRGLGFAPDSAELWLRSARFAHWSGERDRAIEHADRAERLSPNDMEIRTFRDGLFRTQLRASALVTRLPPRYPGLYVGSLQAQRFYGRLELGAEAQFVARVGGTPKQRLLDGLYSAGVFYHSRPRIAFGFGVGFGAPDHVVPRIQLKPSLFYQLTHRWSLAPGYAYWGYRDEKTAHLMSLSVGLALSERLILELRGLASYVIIEPPRAIATEPVTRVAWGGAARLSFRLRPALGVSGGYTYGPQLEQVSGYQFLGLTSHIFTVSADWLFKRNLGFQPSFTFERRRAENESVVLIYSSEFASFVRW
jgi:YaiO family outer membrane protein